MLVSVLGFIVAHCGTVLLFGILLYFNGARSDTGTDGSEAGDFLPEQVNAELTSLMIVHHG